MPIDRPSRGDKPPENPEQQPDRPRMQHIDRPREVLSPEAAKERAEQQSAAWKAADEQRAAEKAEAAERYKENYRKSLGGEPLKLGEGALLDARMRIESRTPEGDFQKITRGVWYSSEPGWGHIESGARDKGKPDELAVKADELLKARGIKNTTLDAHVETKLAARMVDQGIDLMTVVINRQVCRGPRSCDAVLPRLLPEGYKLRVYQGDGTMKLYEGKWRGTG